MTDAAITSEIQKLAPSSVIELFVLDLVLFGQGPVRFHAGTNALQQRVVWQGNAYEAFPIEVEGFEFNGNGQVPRPRLRVAAQAVRSRRSTKTTSSSTLALTSSLTPLAKLPADPT